MPSNFIAVLADVTTRLVNEPDASISLFDLLESSVEAGFGDAGCAYVLNLQNSRYELFWQSNMPDAVESYSLEQIRKVRENERRGSLLENAIAKNSKVLWANTPDTCLAAPIVREGSCLGVIKFRSKPGRAYSTDEATNAQTLASLAALLVEKGETIRLLQRLHRPIDINQQKETFYGDIINLVAEASNMPYVALRELTDEQTLQCIASKGFLVEDEDALSLSPVEDFTSFNSAVRDGAAVVEADMQANHLTPLRSLRPINNVRSFVVIPVKVGTEVFGTLSFGAECPYHYTDLQTNGFETIANSIGIGIANFRNFHTVTEQRLEEGKRIADATALDVAQAARHEARGYIGEMRESILLMDEFSKRGTREDRQKLDERISGLDVLVTDIETAIDRIKAATKEPNMVIEAVNLRDICDQAAKAVTGKMQSLGIAYESEGSGRAEVYPDYMFHVFLNLFLNSNDAFTMRSRKRGRKIAVTFDEGTLSTDNVTVRFRDNATGIDPSSLPKDKKGQPRKINDIFLKSVTTKKEGSGHGLFLVRNILKRHKASIDLVGYRNGVVFDIRIPKRFDKKGKLKSL